MRSSTIARAQPRDRGRGSKARARPDAWQTALDAAGSLAPHAEWRRSLAAATREAAGCLTVAVITCPPGYWFRIQHDTVPARYDALIARISAEFVPRIQSAGEDWRFALANHGLVYAPLETAIAKPLAEELQRTVLAPAGIAGWLTAWFVSSAGRLLGFMVVGTVEPASESLPRLAEPLAAVARRASATLEATLELAQGCGLIVPELDDAQPALTPRELQIADLVVQGYSNGNIAARLSLSANTVGVHVRHVYRKLGVHSRVQVADALRRVMGR